MSLWTGEFGNDYTARNKDASALDRADIWRSLIVGGRWNVNSILEVGANVGKNLEAIETFSSCDLMADRKSVV